MLTDEELKEIEAELVKYPDKQAVCVEAMKIVQRRRRWVSDESLCDIAEVLDMTPDELESVATFYPLIFRKPVGEHVILMCDSVTCWVMGYEQLYQGLIERLDVRFGETTQDDRFTLLQIPCLGTCDHAPALMVDDQLFGDVEVKKLDKILSEFN